MSAETPIAPVLDLDTIVADVEQLTIQAHDFIARDKPTYRQIASEWVPTCTKLKRRLQQLRHWIDEVPAELWDIMLAGRDGGGLGGQLPLDVWREYEAKRHAKVLEMLANIKSTLAGSPKPPPPEDSTAPIPNPDDWPVLCRLCELSETILVSDLAAVLNRDRSALGKHLQHLESCGWVHRPHGERKGVAITSAGRKLCSQAKNSLSH
ncbi:MAG TPA: hypothetical protein VEL76_39495 [Gemmataceae bacterium]|nr:hypothetical protein [Gemmataceae bacterium]